MDRTYSTTISEFGKEVIQIGRVGENQFRSVAVDCTAWLTDFPDGSLALIYQASSGERYMPSNVTISSGVVTWTPEAVDTQTEGVGAIEIELLDNGVVGLSSTAPVRICESLIDITGVPTPAESWLADMVAASVTAKNAADDAENSATDAENAADRAESAAIHQPVIRGGTWWTWDSDVGDYVDTSEPAQGPQGEPGQDGADGADGFSPSATVTQSGSVTTITITDKDGTTTADIDLSDYVTKEEYYDLFPTKTLSTNPAIISDGAKDIPIKSITTDASATVTRTGKNLFDDNAALSSLSNVEELSAHEWHTTSGITPFLSSSLRNGLTNACKAAQKDGARITISMSVKTDANQSTSGNGIKFTITYTDNSTSVIQVNNNQTSYLDVTLTTPAGKTVSTVTVGYGSNGNNNWYLKNIQIKRGTSATAYEEYKGVSATADGNGVVQNPPTTLYGYNYIYSSGATLNVTYREDIGLLIASL